MISVTNAVLDIIKEDEVALEACLYGLLNYSAYADKIQKQVEKKTFKEVKKGTVVAAISRLAQKKLKDIPSYRPQIKISNLTIQSQLYALVYTKTSDVQRRVATLNPFLVSPTDIFSITEGTTEIVLACTETSHEFIKNHIGIIPKKEMVDIVAITVRLSEKISNSPNVLHVLFTALAHKRINLLYVVSGYTEISFLLEKKDMEQAIKAIDVFSSD